MRPLLFLHNDPKPFVKNDLEILRDAFPVREFYFKGILDIPSLLREVAYSSLTFSWFGGFHAFWMVLFSKALRKTSFVVAGGYDVASYPEIQYGAMRKGPRKWMGEFIFALADKVLSVSPFNFAEVIKNLGIKKEKIRLIPLALKTPTLPEGDLEKKKQVVTIATIERGNLLRKGLLFVVKAAQFLPQWNFFVVGQDLDGTLDQLKAIASSNVYFLGYLSEEEKDRLLWESKVYVQASYHEAFGFAVAEAMLRQCIPVVTRRGALPYLVGDTGFYAEDQSPEKIAIAIAKALSAPEENGLRARERIIKNFSIEKRKRLLIREINLLLNGSYQRKEENDQS